MADKIDGHLGEDLIIEAVIDESGMDQAGRRHLVECPQCLAEKELLEGRLGRFTALSREHSPVPLRRVRLPGEEKIRKPFWKTGPAFGIVVVFATLLVFLLVPYLSHRGKDIKLDKIYQEMLRDAQFMAEVEKLEEEPLPVFYVDMTNFGDADSGDEVRDNSLPLDETVT